MKTKCSKCDERGYINHPAGGFASCECGWAIEQQSKIFKDVPIEQLLAYGMRRRAEKEAQM